MDLQRLNPWNWFKHEESQSRGAQIPVKKADEATGLSPHPIQQLHQQIDRLFDDAFQGFGFPGLRSQFDESGRWLNTQSFRPSLNVSSDNKSYQVTLEAPGLSEEDLAVEVSGDVLTIQGSKKEEKESKEKHYYRIERSYGSFQRTLSLPDDANADEIQASMKNGVLSLVIPRREAVDTQVKKITISH